MTDMGTDTNRVNAGARLTQVKVSVDSGTATAFKAACAAASVTMVAELSRFMADYAGGVAKRKAAPDYSTRRQRRKAINEMIRELERILALEEGVLDRTPENLQASSSYEATEEAITTLENAIDILSGF